MAIRSTTMSGRTFFLALLILLTLGVQSAAPVSAYKAASGISDDVHDAITEEAVAVLRADGLVDIADAMDLYKASVEAGSYAADHENMELGTSDPVFPSSNHFHHPETHMGLTFLFTQYMSAADVAQRYYDRAGVRYMAYQRADAYRDLGIALHLLLDLTVPHHSRLASNLPHVWYEDDIPKNSPFIVNVNHGGIYSFAPLAGHYNDDTMWGWADRAAHGSYAFYGYVDGLDVLPNDYEYVQSILLPFAVRLAAGVIKMFHDEYMNTVEYLISGAISPGGTMGGYVSGLRTGPHTVVLMGNEPDAEFDLYVRWGAPPTTTLYDMASTSDDSLEYLTVYSTGLTLYYKVTIGGSGGSYSLVIVHGSPKAASETGGSLSRPGSAQHHSVSFSSSGLSQRGWVFLAGPDSSNFDALLRWGSPPVIMSGNIVTVDAGSYNSKSIEMCTFRSSLTTLYGTAFLRTGSGSYRILVMII